MDLDDLPSSDTDDSMLVDQQFDEESDFTSNPVEFWWLCHWLLQTFSFEKGDV